MAVRTTDGAAITWDELLGDFAPALTSYARSRGVRSAEDLVQDVLVTAVEKLSEFEGDRSGLRSWLFSITYRRIADEHRRFYRRPELLVEDHAPAPDPGADVENLVEDADSAAEAWEALNVLGDRERAVLEMRIVGELSPAEVADRLGISAGNVRVIQARALVKIRKHLESGSNGTGRETIAYGVLPVFFIRCLGSRLPSDDVLGPWIDDLRNATSAGLLFDPGASGIVRAAEGAAAAGGASAVAASSSVGFAAATVVKVGLVAALSATPVVIVGAPGSSAGLEAPIGEIGAVAVDTHLGRVVIAEPAPTTASGVVGDIVDPATTSPGPDSPAGAESVAGVEVPGLLPDGSDGNAPVHTSEVEAVGGDGSALDDLPGLVEDAVHSVTDGVVDPLISGTVGAVTETIHGTLDILERDVMDGVVDPLVDSVVSAVDGTVTGLTDGAVAPLPAGISPVVADVVDELLGGSGLLGGLGG